MHPPLGQEEQQEVDGTDSQDPSFNHCIYGLIAGREMEIDLFRSAVIQFTGSRDRGREDCQRVLVYEGARGFGKSQILAEINYLAQCDDYR